MPRPHPAHPGTLATLRGLTAAVPYAIAFVAVNLFMEGALQLWALLPTRRDPALCMRRLNILIERWGSWLFELTRWAFGFGIDIEGEIPPGRFVVVSNHQSTADIAILIWLLRGKNCKFAVKRSLSRFIPSVSTAVTRGGFAVISREGSRSDLTALRSMARGLGEWDGTAVIFAEGTRSRDGAVLPYHRAALRIVAAESGLPLLPVAIDGTWRASDLLRFPTGLPGRTLRVTIGRPVAVEGRDLDAETVEGIRGWTLAALQRGRASDRMTEPAMEPIGSAQGNQAGAA